MTTKVTPSSESTSIVNNLYHIRHGNLQVSRINTDAQGNATPVYHFNPQSINYSDFYSRWRLQIGFRLTF